MKKIWLLLLFCSLKIFSYDAIERAIMDSDPEQVAFELKNISRKNGPLSERKIIKERTVTAFICSPKISLSFFVLMLGMGLPTFVKLLRQDYRTFAHQEALYDSIGYSSVVIAGILLFMGITEERDARNTNSHGSLATR